MRFHFLAAALVVCSGTSSLAAQLPAQQDPLAKSATGQNATACATTESSCAEAAAKILPQVMGPSPLEENLRRLTDEVGGRVTGSPQMAKAVEWAVTAFRAEGVNVHTEKYTLPVTWSEGETRLELLGPSRFPVRLVAVGWSPATTAGGIEANLIDIGYGDEKDFARLGAAAKGAILLAHTDVGAKWADLFGEYTQPPSVIERSVKVGAAAILWMGARERLLLYRHTNTGDGTLERIPQAVVAREDAMRLARTIAAYPGKVSARFSMPNKIGGPVEQENVIGEIRGREMPEEAVILGAQLGSWQYALAHRPELDKIRAVVIFDSGIGRVSGYSLTGRADIEAGVREILKPLDSWDVTHHTLDGDIGTDNWDFFLEGVPTLVAEQDEANYLPNYHAASDTFDKVDIRELKINTALAAVTAWGLADRAEPLGKRLSRAEMDRLLKETHLDEKMRQQGYWEPWQNGTRGRKP